MSQFQDQHNRVEAALPPVCVAVLIHNEERRLAACLDSLPLGDPYFAVHAVINGSTDGSLAIAQGYATRYSNLTVHQYQQGGKSRSWNRFLFVDLPTFHNTHIFVDGDAVIVPGSLQALEAMLAHNPRCNAVAALPGNGRQAEYYRTQMQKSHGIFGDLYALRGDFLTRMKAHSIRLPDDLIGDDGLIGALAKTDLDNENHWDETRLLPVLDAAFLCEPVSLVSPHTWRMQYKRMINYSVRHFQNRIISDIMRGAGPKALPRDLAALYPAYLSSFSPRKGLAARWFDRIALQRMARQARLFG